jgi:hypothetical protein
MKTHPQANVPQGTAHGTYTVTVVVDVHVWNRKQMNAQPQNDQSHAYASSNGDGIGTKVGGGA